jgi:hypothetical protein
MAGTVEGGKAAAGTNKKKYRNDFYGKIGAIGGRLGRTGGSKSEKGRCRRFDREGAGERSRRQGWTYQQPHEEDRSLVLALGQHMSLRAIWGFFDACVPATMPRMAQTDESTRLKLTLSPHVAEILTGWAVFELRKTPEEVLEALAEELCSNEQLRAFTAGLVGE